MCTWTTPPPPPPPHIDETYLEPREDTFLARPLTTRASRAGAHQKKSSMPDTAPSGSGTVVVGSTTKIGIQQLRTEAALVTTEAAAETGPLGVGVAITCDDDGGL
jgi:hypothetical protein